MTGDDVAEGTPGRSRQLPVFFCPYCGDEELTPHEGTGSAAAAGWQCGACLRAFTVRLLATGVQGA